MKLVILSDGISMGHSASAMFDAMHIQMGFSMFTLDGTGARSHFSLRHRPDFFHEPFVFSALAIKGADGLANARVLERPVPAWKMFFPWDRNELSNGVVGEWLNWVEGDFRCFLATAGGFGTVGVRAGEPFLEVKSGRIDVDQVVFHRR